MNVADNNKIRTWTRIGTMALDHLIMSGIAMIFFTPDIISIFDDTFKSTNKLTSQGFVTNKFDYISLIGFAIYFCKDCLNGQSVSKRILKLQLVDNTTGQVASPWKCFVRNIFLILWPIEAIVALKNPSKRLGDKVAGTKLIIYDPTLNQPKVNLGQVLIILTVAYGLLYLIMVIFKVRLT